MKSFNITIEHSCPQCGAPAVLEETDRLFFCPYCRVSSFLVEDTFFRYILPNNNPNIISSLYFPYWRFKGTLFSCYLDKTDYRFLDISHQGINSTIFPVSLGFRSQALKLKFAHPGYEGKFIKPELSLDDILCFIEKRFCAKESDIPSVQYFLGETASIIYSPYYLKNGMLWDGVLNKEICTTLPKDLDVNLLKAEKPGWRIGFIPSICPNCGWNLSGKKDSIVLMCKNCDSAWQPRKNKLEPQQQAHSPLLAAGLASESEIDQNSYGRRFSTACSGELQIIDFGHFAGIDTELLFLPFWQIKACVSDIALASYADLIKIANLPKVIQKSWHNMDFKFWIPAFKIRAKHFVRLASQFTLVQPFDEIVKKVPDADMHPVTLPIAEAIESIKIILSDFIKPKKDYFPLLPDIKIGFESYKLLYIPFKKEHFDLIQPKYKISLNKSVLETAGNL